jgi:protease I
MQEVKMAVRGKKIAMLIEQDYEDIEVTEPLKIFKDAGIQVTIVGNNLQTNYTGKRKESNFRADTTPDKIYPQEYDAIYIPGGYAPDKMRLHQPMIDLVQKFNDAGKLITALCHGPQLLISAGLVKGRRVTSWPSVAIDLKNAGATYIDEPVVKDGRFITSRKPDDIPQFTKAVIEALERVPVVAG